MKICLKCEVEKPLSEFYRYKKTSELTSNKCKTCTKADVKLNRKSKKEYYLEYDRNRPNKELRNQKNIERTKHKYSTDENYKASIQETKKNWAERNPLKRKAQWAATNAVRDGKLERKHFCEHCGTSEKKLQKHHWSYLEENWLDVIWLCTKCHGAEHKRLNELGRDPDA